MLSLLLPLALADEGPQLEVPPLDLPAVVHHESGALSGLVVYLSAGHGRRINKRGRKPSSWDFQRPTFGLMLEDTWTASFVTHHLAPALERAGAVVLTPRERDPNRQAVVVDDADPGFVALGRGNQLETHTTLDAGSRGSFTVAAPADGEWHLYTRWAPSEATAAYTVEHPGGADRFVVEQATHAGQWWPIGRYALQKGEQVVVHVEGDASFTVDQVRLGGGSYTVACERTQRWINTPAFAVSALHHLVRTGVPDDVAISPEGIEEHSDARIRHRWATWAQPDGEKAVYLAIHSDAGGGTGTTAFAGTGEGVPLPLPDSMRLANLVRTGLVDAARTRAPNWVDRGTKTAGFSEIQPHIELPSALVEVGFHDHPRDREFLLDPTFQADVADGIVAGVVRWVAGEDAPAEPRARRPLFTSTLPPRPPVSSWLGSEVAWEARRGDVVRGWRIRERRNGTWSPPRWTVSGRWLAPDEVDAIEVTAVNEAGLGRPATLERPRPSDG